MSIRPDRPSLRVLYSQGEREDLLKSLLPKPSDLEPEDFRQALQLSIDHFKDVETIVRIAFERSGLSEYETLQEQDALSILNEAVLEPVQFLHEVIPDVPEWFTLVWCTRIMESLHQKRVDLLAEQREDIRQGKKPATIERIAPGTLGSGPLALKDMTFELTMERNQKGSRLCIEELAASRCLLPGKAVDQTSSYSFKSFMQEFHTIINQSRESPLRLDRGALGYRTQAGAFKPISNQRHFETAIDDLYSNRGKAYKLKFYHREENNKERDSRTARTAAAKRLKDGPQKAGTAIANRSKVAEKSPKDDQQKTRASSANRVQKPERGRSPGPRPIRGPFPPPTPAPTVPLPPLPTLKAKDKGIAEESVRKANVDGAGALNVVRQADQSATPSGDRNKPLPPAPTGGLSGTAPRVSKTPSLLLHPSSGRATTIPRKPSPAEIGSRRVAGPPVTPVKPTGNHDPPRTANDTQKAKQLGNQLKLPAHQGFRDASPASSSVRSSIKNDRNSPAGLHVLSPASAGGSSKASSAPDPSTPSVAIKRLPKGVSRAPPSQLSYLEGAASLSTLPIMGPRLPTLPKQRRKQQERVIRISSGEAPSTPRDFVKKALVNIIVPTAIGASRRVSQFVEMVSPTTPTKGASDYTTNSPRNSFVSRVSAGLKESEFGTAPAARKTLGISTPRFFSKANKWEKQDLEFKGMGKVLEVYTYRRGGDELVDDTADLFKDIEKEVQPGEVNDLSEMRGDSDDDEPLDAPGEYMVQQLQKMQNMPELAQMYDHGFSHPFPEKPEKSQQQARWKECCQLFQRDPDRTSIDERVQLAGLKTPIYLYQAFGVYWQLKTSRAMGGGFVCDEMGLGKTLSFLAYMVVERQLAMLHWQVDHPDHLKNQGHEHLTAEEAALDPTLVCPSASRRGPGWIPCPCVSAITAQLAPKPGVRLAVVPPSLVSTWVEQWNTHIDEANQLMQMRLIIAHDASNDKPIGGGYDLRDGRHRSNQSRVIADHIEYPGRQDTDHTKEFFSDGARYAQERLLVLTTAEYWVKHWAKQFERVAPKWSWDNKEEGELLQSQKIPGIVYGIAMIDECHEEFQKNKGRSAVLASLPPAGRPFIWGYSGTPITTTPRCLEGVLWAIEKLWPKSHKRNVNGLTGLEQEIDSGLALFSCQRLGAIAKEFETDVRENRGTPILFRDIYLRLKPFLLMFMLRRTADTPWFGQPLIKLPPHVHQDIVLEHEVEYDDKLEQWGWQIDAKMAELQEKLRAASKDELPKKLGFNAEMRMRHSQRIMATFPYLVQNAALTHSQHLDLTFEELKKFRGTNEKRPVNPYWTHLKGIGARSPKMMWIYHFLKELDQTRDVHGQEQKVVIMSEFNQVALVVKLFLETYVKDKSKRVGLVYAGMPPRERRAILDAFVDATDDKGHRKQKADYQILVGTSRIIGAGLQLTRACNVILMEPDYEFARELQGYARVHRIGQKNAESRSYRLLESGNEIEKRILQRQALRGEFPGKPDEEEESVHRYGDVTEIVEKYAQPSDEATDVTTTPLASSDDPEMRAFLQSLPPSSENLKLYPSETVGNDDLYDAN